MESETLNSVYDYNTQLNINEEDLKKSKDPQNQHIQKAGHQLSSSPHQKSFNLSNINDTTQERDNSRISLLNPENLIPNSRVYQEYINTYQKITSMYIFKPKRNKNITELIIYDTESRRESKKIMDWSKAKITVDTKITQLPNGDLFCFRSSSCKDFRRTFILDCDFNYHILPPGKDGINSIAIYYNRSVYCFASTAYDNYSIGSRFDLDYNYWSNLSPIPESIAWSTNVIFNGNILISSFQNPGLWLYSIDIDSFSTIPYTFSNVLKMMTNAGDRLYLIQIDSCYWSIHESGIDDEFSWKPVKYLPNIILCNGRAYNCIYSKKNKYFIYWSLKMKFINQK